MGRTYITIIRSIFIILICLIVIFTATGCGKTSADDKSPEMHINIDEKGNTVYDGSELYFYEVSYGQKATARFKFTYVSGSVSIDIHEKNNPGNYQYRGTVTDSCNFDVIIDSPNEYCIFVRADGFHGSYCIEWQSEYVIG